jgi:SAM-dependent methyltransferase
MPTSKDADELNAFVGSLSNRLTKVQDRLWTTGSAELVSYPIESHSACADVELRSYWFEHRNRCILPVVKRFPPHGPILDAGGGNGVVSLALNKAGFSTIVLEPGGGAMTAHLRGLPVIQTTLSGASIANGVVPAIGMFDVIEHIDDDRAVLAELRRILRQDGWLYLAVPAFPWLWSSEDADAGHFRRYTINSLSKKVSESGFKVAFATYMFAPLVMPILLLRTVPSYLGMLRSPSRDIAADHTLPTGIIGRSIKRALAAEETRLVSGKRIIFGSSVLLAAQRV